MLPKDHPNWYRRLFPNSIGASFGDFLFGSRCPRCDSGSFVNRWNRYDGTGSWRMHTSGFFPDTFESEFCGRNGWFSRHWFTTAVLIFVALIFLCAGAGMARAGGESAFPDERCNGGGRYEAMAAGADCFNPPIFPRNRPSCWQIRMQVHLHGEQAVEQIARSHGATDADIARGKKCLR